MFARKINKLPEFYRIFAKKCLNYMIFAINIFLIFGGWGLPPSPTPVRTIMLYLSVRAHFFVQELSCLCPLTSSTCTWWKPYVSVL